MPGHRHCSGVAIDISADAFDLAEPMRPSGPRWGRPDPFILGGGETRDRRDLPSGNRPPEGFRAIGSASEPSEAGAVVTVDVATYDGLGLVHFQ